MEYYKNQDYKLEVNTRPSELEAIFDGNHQNMITEKTCIWKNDFDKLVCVQSNEAVGYLVVYKKSDWIKQEEYPIDFKSEENCVYIWNMVTKKQWQGKGVATFLLENLKEQFGNKVIYVTADIKNIGSVKAIERAGFEFIMSFEAKLPTHKTIKKWNLYLYKNGSYIKPTGIQKKL